jgi:uncharacterized protein YbjT (DUF2867 family)
MSDGRVLVAGATGQLGSAVARQLLEAGVPIRALARNREKLQPLADAGAEVAAVDLMDNRALADACKGITQIVSTANNNRGSGATSPGKIDLTAHQNLAAATRNARVKRLMYVSYRFVSQDEAVDIFRVKWYIEDAIKRSGVPYAFVRPSLFMDVWFDHVMADRVRKKGGAVIFGDGSAVQNWIAVDDVARYVVAIVKDESVVNEAVEVGGPSNMSLNDVATLIERHHGASGRRQHIPVWSLKLLPPVVRFVNEIQARLMTLGYHVTTSRPLPDWKKNAERFGVAPRTVEEYVQRMATS